MPPHNRAGEHDWRVLLSDAFRIVRATMRYPAYPLREQGVDGMSVEWGVVWNPRNGGHFAL